MQKISLALTICLLGLIGLPANAAKKLEDNNSDSADLENTFITNKPKATKLTTKTATATATATKPETKTATKTAPTISGAFGFTFGSYFDTKAPGVTYDAKDDVYKVKPPKPYRKWFNYLVGITPISRKICYIRANFMTPDKAEFNTEKEIIFRLLTDKYYYGEKQNFKYDEFFYHDQSSTRSVDLFFTTLDNGDNWMQLTYIDSALINSEPKEKSKNKAQDGDSL